MSLGMVWVDLSVIIILISLFSYLIFVRNQLQRQLEHQHQDLGETLVAVVDQFSKNFSAEKQHTYKDAKNMMALRLEELKFVMLEKAASFASEKFFKTNVGVHQIMPPDETNDNKPNQPTG